ncbi:MAG: ribonuclease HII [Oscillospiraceae bacterium]|nr:ribonuclease HII [Oscillospiraceae bacterium]
MKNDTPNNLFAYDQELCQGTALVLCGVDEAGRGPLAGPVCAGACVLPQGFCPSRLNDSKKLSEKRREELFEELMAHAYCGVGWASVEEIEEHNILNATFLAMNRAYQDLCAKLPSVPDIILVDGNRHPGIQGDVRLVVKGDATSAAVAAASILAKVSRDRYMLEQAAQYPQYQFEKHKGYGTALHCQMLREHGPSPIHRPSFLGKILGDKA